MKRAHLLLSILALTLNATAYELSVDHGIATTHVFAQQEYNEDNELRVVEFVSDNLNVHASTFINSYGSRTTSLGSSYSLLDTKHVDIDVMFGVMHGYTKDEMLTCNSASYCAYAAPRLKLSYPITTELTISSSTLILGTAVVLTTGLTYNF